MKPLRRLQFSLRTLLITVSILGPVAAWYGPPIVRFLQGLVSEQNRDDGIRTHGGYI